MCRPRRCPTSDAVRLERAIDCFKGSCLRSGEERTEDLAVYDKVGVNIGRLDKIQHSMHLNASAPPPPMQQQQMQQQQPSLAPAAGSTAAVYTIRHCSGGESTRTLEVTPTLTVQEVAEKNSAMEGLPVTELHSTSAGGR